MERTREHKAYQLKRRPREYPRLPQQQKLLDALEFCGIGKGISKSNLMKAMKQCLPDYFAKQKEENQLASRPPLFEKERE